ncbi:MAG: cytochrome c biogenesis protein ResB [Elusimicrobiales bacterium]|jgi:cytochrome c biogenesis protein ResB
MKILNALSSIKLFLILSALILAAFVIGGVFPQGLSPQEYQEMFGRVGAAWIARSRFNDVFSGFWFLALMAGALINLLACTVKQWKPLRLRPGVFVSHLAVILLFIGAMVRGVYRVSGTMPLETGETRNEFTTAEGGSVTLPFEVRLKDFRITYWDGERHFIHAFRDGSYIAESVEAHEGGAVDFKTVPISLKVLKFYPDFAIGPSGPFNAGESRSNPALTIAFKNKKNAGPQYLFARYPDYHGAQDASGIRLVYEHLPGRIKQFESLLAISEGGELKLERAISVNSPASYRGYRLYQAGYDAQNPRFSNIQVSRDPSIKIIYAGFALLMMGLTLAFWKEIKQ